LKGTNGCFYRGIDVVYAVFGDALDFYYLCTLKTTTKIQQMITTDQLKNVLEREHALRGYL